MRSARTGERGIALVFTLFLMAALSAMAVSLMFLAQTETSASRNYKTMSQARYAGEAGIHKALNYMLYTYTPPSTSGSDQLTAYDATSTTTCPDTTLPTCVFYNSAPVILSATSGVTANYPDSTKSAAFASAATGTLNVGTGTVNYSAYAKLISQRSLVVYGGGTGVIQTWQITATGTVPGALPATVEVTALMERTVVPAETFAVFATANTCGAITYDGNGGTDSYDSTALTLSAGVPVTQNYGGAIGTNGNVDIGGTVGVHGSVSTPRTGVGACLDGAAITGSGSPTWDSMIRLPQEKSYETPAIPANTSSIDLSLGSSTLGLTCDALVSAQGWSCSKDASNVFTLTPDATTTTSLSLRNVNLGSNVGLKIGGNGSPAPNIVMNWNSFAANGSSTLEIASSANTVTMNMTGAGLSTSTPVVDFAGNFSTTTFDSSKLQIVYAGEGEIKLRGANSLAATIYAPNAHVDMASGYDVYGSILAKTYTNSGGANVHYDRSLASKYFTLSNYVMSSFSWKKY